MPKELTDEGVSLPKPFNKDCRDGSFSKCNDSTRLQGTYKTKKT